MPANASEPEAFCVGDRVRQPGTDLEGTIIERTQFLDGRTEFVIGLLRGGDSKHRVIARRARDLEMVAEADSDEVRGLRSAQERRMIADEMWRTCNAIDAIVDKIKDDSQNVRYGVRVNTNPRENVRKLSVKVGDLHALMGRVHAIEKKGD